MSDEGKEGAGWVDRCLRIALLGCYCVVIVLASPLILVVIPFWIIGKIAMLLKIDKLFD